MLKPSCSHRSCCGVSSLTSSGVRGHWYLSALQALVQQHKAVCVPVQCFDPIHAASAEQEQTARKRIEAEAALRERGQPVDPAPQIGIAAGDIRELPQLVSEILSRLASYRIQLVLQRQFLRGGLSTVIRTKKIRCVSSGTHQVTSIRVRREDVRS